MALRDVREAVVEWRRAGLVPTIGLWSLVSLVIAVALIVATGAIAMMSAPTEDYDLAGVSRPVEDGDLGFIVTGNLLVLALHALACLAAYLARRSLPAEASRYRSRWRNLNTRVGAAALVCVAAATVASFTTQARALGAAAATVAHHLDTTPWMLLAVVSVHALPELAAMFLPLAAWALLGVRGGRWNDLLAATVATSAVAVPVIVVSGWIEVGLTPQLINAVIVD